MRDNDGFLIRCEHSDWKIIDNRDNKDFVCCVFGDKTSGRHLCYADEHCKFYEPKEDKKQ